MGMQGWHSLKVNFEQFSVTLGNPWDHQNTVYEWGLQENKVTPAHPNIVTRYKSQWKPIDGTMDKLSARPNSMVHIKNPGGAEVWGYNFDDDFYVWPADSTIDPPGGGHNNWWQPIGKLPSGTPMDITAGRAGVIVLCTDGSIYSRSRSPGDTFAQGTWNPLTIGGLPSSDSLTMISIGMEALSPKNGVLYGLGTIDGDNGAALYRSEKVNGVWQNWTTFTGKLDYVDANDSGDLFGVLNGTVKEWSSSFKTWNSIVNDHDFPIKGEPTFQAVAVAYSTTPYGLTTDNQLYIYY